MTIQATFNHGKSGVNNTLSDSSFQSRNLPKGVSSEPDDSVLLKEPKNAAEPLAPDLYESYIEKVALTDSDYIYEENLDRMRFDSTVADQIKRVVEATELNSDRSTRSTVHVGGVENDLYGRSLVKASLQYLEDDSTTEVRISFKDHPVSQRGTSRGTGRFDRAFSGVVEHRVPIQYSLSVVLMMIAFQLTNPLFGLLGSLLMIVTALHYDQW